MIAALFHAVLLSLAVAGAEPFASVEQERRYYELLKELRCLVCQNQSLSDSSAELAGDLRDEVRAMVADGKSNREIVTYMHTRTQSLRKWWQYTTILPRRTPPIRILVWSSPSRQGMSSLSMDKWY